MGRPLKSFASATLNIQWPKENKEGKWLLYLLQITGPNNQSIPCSPASEISPRKHAQEVMSRGKRQAEASALSTDGLLSLFGGKRHYKYLVRLTVFPEKKPTFLSRFPWWVILLSVVLALLLLSLLIYFLSKVITHHI
ncbi:hypothetical protein PDJAM_G00227010 [Pangasius djambal]|uniref:Uncharacterized protein n=1 Tax=Pangasius djambal TaxID=1691987 RepID=A0ACC5YDL0_9TELE|nr:hypothetical protein [Pangasius djambal]